MNGVVNTVVSIDELEGLDDFFNQTLNEDFDFERPLILGFQVDVIAFHKIDKNNPGMMHAIFYLLPNCIFNGADQPPIHFFEQLIDGEFDQFNMPTGLFNLRNEVEIVNTYWFWLK